MSLPFMVGSNAQGPYFQDLADLPHLLVAGTTGSGKSVFVHSLLYDLITRSDCRFLMFDPKRVELSYYRDSTRLLFRPIVDMKEAAEMLVWAAGQMEARFKLLEAKGLRDWKDLNPASPRMVIVIDELANLILSDKTVEKPLVTIASQGRAAGMHLVLATQRPSAEVLTGLLRANIPARAAFATITSIESRIILDEIGAEKLQGKGDMLYRNGTRMMHLRGRMVPQEKIMEVTK